MTAREPSGQRQWIDQATLLARWLLGALFLYMGLSKALDPVAFLKLVRQYDLVQSTLLLNTVAAVLPWFEAFCGLLLLAGVAVRGCAIMLVVMLVPFTLMVLNRALEIQGLQALPFCAIKFDCGCGMGEVFICAKLAENTILTLFSIWLVFGRGRQFSLKYALGSNQPMGRRVG